VNHSGVLGEFRLPWKRRAGLPITKSKNGKRVGDIADSTLMTIEDVQRMGTFFKELVESSHLKWWIIFAGVGGLCELIRIIIDAVRVGLELSGHHVS
jgi:hypothetical protein